MNKSTEPFHDIAGYSPKDEVDWIVKDAKKSFSKDNPYERRRPRETFQPLNNIPIFLST